MRVHSKPRRTLASVLPPVVVDREFHRAARVAAVWTFAILAALGATVGAGAGPAGVELGTAISLDTSHAPLDGEWVVVAVTAPATWRPEGDARWQPIVAGAVLPAPSEIETGPAGGVTLVLGGDRLVVAPDSRLVLIARRRGEDQRLRQERGRLRVDVEPRIGRDVQVRTPLLSLGIKGTSFEVAVDPWQSSILVLDGRVTVSTANGGPPVELGPQQGLSQPADPSQPPRRLEFGDPGSTFSRTGPVHWHLAPVAAPAQAVGEQAVGEPADGAAGPTLRRPLAPASETGAAQPDSRTWFGAWLDERLLLTLGLIGAAGLGFLVVPGLVLGQNLRQQWLDRPGGKGKRRRNLIRGW
jgi:hypothetical protein